MLSILLWAFVFCLSLFFVIKSADYFTESAEKFAVSLGISQWVIGLTLVAIGTSLPELFTSLASVFAGRTELVADNIVGSNIANILLIVGVSAIFAGKLVVKRDIIDLDLPLLAGSQAVLLFVLFDGKVNRVEGVISLFVLAVYLLYTLRVHAGETTEHKHKKEGFVKLCCFIIGSLAVLIIASKFTIDSLIRLGDLLGIGSSVLGVTALAIGTSLPELMVSVSAARRGAYELSFGNIFGSNIFNGAGIIGISAVVAPLAVSAATLSVLGFLIAATVLYIISGISRRIHIWEGLMFLAVYALFIGKLFGLF